MTKTKTVTFVLVLLLGVVLSSSSAQNRAIHEARAAAMETAAIRFSSADEFGRAIARQSLLAAARELRKGAASGRVELTVVVSVEELTKPDLPDKCFETCLSYGTSSALSCYVSCNAPVPSRTH